MRRLRLFPAITLAGALSACVVGPPPWHPDPTNWPRVALGTAKMNCVGTAFATALGTTLNDPTVRVGSRLFVLGPNEAAENAVYIARNRCIAAQGWLPERPDQPP